MPRRLMLVLHLAHRLVGDLEVQLILRVPPIHHRPRLSLVREEDAAERTHTSLRDRTPGGVVVHRRQAVDVVAVQWEPKPPEERLRWHPDDVAGRVDRWRRPPDDVAGRDI